MTSRCLICSVDFTEDVNIYDYDVRNLKCLNGASISYSSHNNVESDLIYETPGHH